MQSHKVKVFRMKCETSPSGCPISPSSAAGCLVMTYMCVHVRVLMFVSLLRKKGLVVRETCLCRVVGPGSSPKAPSLFSPLWVFQYLGVYWEFLLQETTAKEVVMLALQEFGVTDDSR